MTIQSKSAVVVMSTLIGLTQIAFAQTAVPCDPGALNGGCTNSTPKILSKVEGQYTKEAQAAGIQGTVVLQFDVGVDGLPHNILVLQRVDPGLDQSAIEALSQWRFQPGTKDGRPVTWNDTKVSMDFRLAVQSQSHPCGLKALTFGTSSQTASANDDCLPTTIPNTPTQAANQAIEHQTDDIETVVHQFLTTGAGTKSEFETTAQFETRMKQLTQPDKKYAFAYDLSCDDHYCVFMYDADEAVMTASIMTTGHAADANHSYTITIKDVMRHIDRHIGQNAYGAKVDVVSSFSDNYAILISRDADVWLHSFSPRVSDPGALYSTLQFPLNIERARRLKMNLRVIFVGTIPNAQVYRESGFRAATVSDPSERTLQWFYINFDLSEVRIIDVESGHVVADFSREEATSQIGPHRIGETFQVWLAINQIDLPALCREDKGVCKRLTAIQHTGHGEFSTADASHGTVGWIFKGGKVIERKLPKWQQILRVY
jgi:TonB family protein